MAKKDKNKKIENEEINETPEFTYLEDEENKTIENDVIEAEENFKELELKETLQRLQAEFDNYRKRSESLSEKLKEDGVVYSVGKLLPVLDSFKNAKLQVQDEEYLKSLELVEKQFLDCLKDLKIEKIEAENAVFDPRLHNAVLTGQDEEKEDGVILDVYQDGYKLNDRVIRYSVVRINKL